jgi:hypothetical protein
MQKIMAVTDLKGTLLGVVRTDPIDIGNGKTIRAVPPPATHYHHHVLDVADDFMRRPATAIHNDVRRLIATSKPK